MKNRNNIFLFLIVTVFSCLPQLKTEVVIKSTEIGVYYNSELNKKVVLNSGKHKVPVEVYVYTYPIVSTNITKNVQVLTKDKKSLTFKIDYLYSVNANNISEFNSEVGGEYLDRYILPNLYSELRKSFSEYDLLNVKTDKIQKEIEFNLSNESEYARYIKTNSFKIESKGNQ